MGEVELAVMKIKDYNANDPTLTTTDPEPEDLKKLISSAKELDAKWQSLNKTIQQMLTDEDKESLKLFQGKLTFFEEWLEDMSSSSAAAPSSSYSDYTDVSLTG